VAKTSGLGARLFVGGRDLSGDVGAVSRIAGGPATLDVTGIDKSAMERIGGQRDGGIEFNAFYNPATAQAHPVLSALPTTDVLVTYLHGVTLGNPGACCLAKQINYDGTRGNDGAFTFAVQALSNSYGLEWGVQHTAGLRTDTAATNGTGVDGAASSAFGLQAYLHVTAFTGTDVTIKLQESSDDGGGDAYGNVTGGGFTQVTSAPFAQRIATSAVQTVEQFLRVSTTTSGGVTSVTFSVVVVRNLTATVF
jgi:hypothetical protein